jgi:hypothetical protein
MMLSTLSSGQFGSYSKEHVSPCYFPVLNDDPPASNELHEVTASVDRSLELHNFCKNNNITPASLLHLAWAMTFTSDTWLLDEISLLKIFCGVGTGIVGCLRVLSA